MIRSVAPERLALNHTERAIHVDLSGAFPCFEGQRQEFSKRAYPHIADKHVCNNFLVATVQGDESEIQHAPIRPKASTPILTICRATSETRVRRHRNSRGTYLVRSFRIRDVARYAHHSAVRVSHLYLLLQQQDLRFGFVVSQVMEN